MCNKSAFRSFSRKLNTIVLLTCVILMFICFFTSRGKKDNDSYTQVLEPYTVANLSNGAKEYYFNLVDYDYKYSGIMFYTSHQFVEVYNAGKLIYSFDTPGGIWGTSPGSAYNFIEVNEKMLHIAIKVTPAYPIVANQDMVFYIGSSYQMFNDLLSESMPHYVASLLIVLFSVVLLIYYLLMQKKQHLERSLIHLSLFAFFLGIWTYTETTVEVLICKNAILDSLLPYFCLMLGVPPFILFFDKYLELRSNWIRKTLLGGSIILSVILIILHFTKIAEFRENLIFIQIMLVIAAIYAISGVIYQVVRRNFTRHVVVCAIGLSLIFIAIIADIVKFYTKTGDSDFIGRYLFLIFVLLLAWDLLRSTYDIIEKGRRAKQLETFALTDSMTGLFNRNAFETHIKNQHSIEGLTVVVADANGLKKCNDTYGHDVGDEYITTVADMFSKVYGQYGECYRTGGDEFCCIIPANKSTDMERLKKAFAAKIYSANLEGEYDFNIGVAVGHAKYNSAVDIDFKSLIKRADTHMYENKRKSKRIS